MNMSSILLVGCLSFAAATPAFAQGRPTTAPVAGAVAREQARAQDRLQDRDDTEAARDRARLRERDTIYGYDLMTEQERVEYRAKMRSLRTEREREALRLQHHALMKARARERGVELPELPPARGWRRGGD